LRIHPCRRHSPQLAKGDKTGTAMAPGVADKYNDLAVVWPKGKPPLVVTAFYETPVARGGGMRDADQRVLAQVGSTATQRLAR
jgi:beta-lactamase class A